MFNLVNLIYSFVSGIASVIVVLFKIIVLIFVTIIYAVCVGPLFIFEIYSIAVGIFILSFFCEKKDVKFITGRSLISLSGIYLVADILRWIGNKKFKHSYYRYIKIFVRDAEITLFIEMAAPIFSVFLPVFEYVSWSYFPKTGFVLLTIAAFVIFFFLRDVRMRISGERLKKLRKNK